MHNIKLCVFDMAGTTVAEDNLVYKTVQRAINNQGFAVDLATCLQHGAGKEKYQAIFDIVTASGMNQTGNIDEKCRAAFAEFKQLLSSAYNPQTIKSFAGVVDFFKLLRANNIIVVLNTGYDNNTACKILKILNWQVGVDIDDLICADDVANGRPSADMIHLAMRQHNIKDSHSVLKAGDSIIDILEGKNANCGKTVGCLSGAQTFEQLLTASPDIIVEHLTDLTKYFNF